MLNKAKLNDIKKVRLCIELTTSLYDLLGIKDFLQTFSIVVFAIPTI